MPIRTFLARAATLCRAAVVASALALAGCYDIEAKLTFNPNATAAVDAGLRFDAEMEEVFGFFEAIAQLKPEGAVVKDGLCNALSLLGAAAPPGVELSGRQMKSGDRFLCQANAKIAEARALETNAELSQFFEIKPAGARRYRVALNLGNIPDLSTMMMGLMLKDLPPGERPSEADSQALYKKYVAATLALTRITMRDRYVELAIAAPRIVESNGTVATDGKLVRFRFTSEEMTRLMLDADARRGRDLYAIIEY